MNTLSLPKYSVAQGAITIPGSKSISNRVLLLAAFSQGTTHIHGLLQSDDVHYMTEALKTLGIKIEIISPSEFIVTGNPAGFPNKNAELFLGNAGTAFRSLTAATALNQGYYILKGIPRMHERPIKDLVSALNHLGLRVSYIENEGFPPLKIEPATVTTHNVAVKGSVSSQYLTGLLLSLPITQQESTITIEGELISKPYIEITLSMLKDFGINIINHSWQTFTVPANQTYLSPKEYYVEGDASSASYFAALGAIGGTITLHGVGTKTLQGDIKFLDALELMGANIEWQERSVTVSKPNHKLKGIDIDCNHIPDAAMTLAILALFAEGKTTLRNIASWRVKETDRIAAMATELTKLGVKVEEGADYITVYPMEKLIPNISIATYDDHRIAMCFALCSFLTPIIIEEPECVNKTFPAFFNEFQRLVK